MEPKANKVTWTEKDKSAGEAHYSWESKKSSPTDGIAERCVGVQEVVAGRESNASP